MPGPRLLDLYCCEGGASEGYSRAGYDCYGVDTDPHCLKRYPFPFVQMDALEVLRLLLAGEGVTFSNGEVLYLQDFASIHASPPCPGYSRLRHLPWLKGRTWPLLIEPTREYLVATGKPYVIENVMDAPLRGAWLCGRMFDLPLYRHRRFETNWRFIPPFHRKHGVVIGRGRMVNDRGKGTLNAGSAKGAWGTKQGVVTVAGGQFLKADGEAAMGIDWMSKPGLKEAIPPVMTEYIGRQLLNLMEVC